MVRGMVWYMRIVSECQSPNAFMSCMGMPDWYYKQRMPHLYEKSAPRIYNIGLTLQEQDDP